MLTTGFKKSLAVTLKQLLDELPYSSKSEYCVAYNPHFSTSLSEAVRLYTKAREEALSLLYKNKELNAERPMEMVADFEEVAASCGYFSFSLQDFASEMKVYLGLLEELKHEVEHRPHGRTWEWLKFWHLLNRTTNERPGNDPGKMPLNSETKPPIEPPLEAVEIDDLGHCCGLFLPIDLFPCRCLEQQVVPTSSLHV